VFLADAVEQQVGEQERGARWLCWNARFSGLSRVSPRVFTSRFGVNSRARRYARVARQFGEGTHSVEVRDNVEAPHLVGDVRSAGPTTATVAPGRVLLPRRDLGPRTRSRGPR
jgi:hypothetical protein